MVEARVDARSRVIVLLQAEVSSTFCRAYALVTVQVAALALIIAMVVGATRRRGLAALRRDTWVDRGLVALAVLFLSLPEFWFALLMIFLFAVTWRIFPGGGLCLAQRGRVRERDDDRAARDGAGSCDNRL